MNDKKWQEIINVLENMPKVPLPDNFSSKLHQKLVLLNQAKKEPACNVSDRIKDIVYSLEKALWIKNPVFARVIIVLFVVLLPAYLIVYQYNIRKNTYATQAQLCSMPVNKTIVLSFNINAKENLKDVTLTVNLPEEFQLVDTGNFSNTDHKVVWQGDLIKGNNLIAIKVKSFRGGDWQVRALLEKEGRSKWLEKTIRTI